MTPIRLLVTGSYACYPGCDGVNCCAAALNRNGYFAVAYTSGLNLRMSKN